MPSSAVKWDQLRAFVDSVKSGQLTLIVATSVVFPIGESVLSSLLFASQAFVLPASIALAAVGFLHLVLAAIVVRGELLDPATNALDAIEAEQELEKCRRELSRRSETYCLIRSAFDALNLQACNMIADERGSQPSPFGVGLKPVVDELTCGFAKSLGLNSVEFTVAAYFEPDAIMMKHENSIGVVAGKTHSGIALLQVTLANPQGVSDSLAFDLQNRSILDSCWRREMPGEATIDDDRMRFFVDAKPHEDVYFYRYATVPVYYACSKDQAGILVVTSRQASPFADDVIDVMQFIASLLSQYAAAYNRCVNELGSS